MKTGNLIYKWLDFALGQYSNPIAWKPVLVEFSWVYLAAGVAGALIFHFTKTTNLNTIKQDKYFRNIAVTIMVLLWIYTSSRISVKLADYSTLDNYVKLCLLGATLQFLLFYVITYYVIRYLPYSTKKYVPTFLTSFLHPKTSK